MVVVRFRGDLMASERLYWDQATVLRQLGLIGEDLPVTDVQPAEIRRLQLLAAAEHLFAERGFLAVRLEDIGEAAGVSGPAIYRHFSNKESMLAELLVGTSARLLDGAREVTERNNVAIGALNGLIESHLDFAFSEPDLIRIQDRDLAHLPTPAERQVRRAQRQYV